MNLKVKTLHTLSQNSSLVGPLSSLCPPWATVVIQVLVPFSRRSDGGAQCAGVPVALGSLLKDTCIRDLWHAPRLGRQLLAQVTPAEPPCRQQPPRDIGSTLHSQPQHAAPCTPTVPAVTALSFVSRTAWAQLRQPCWADPGHSCPGQPTSLETESDPNSQ